MSTRNSERSSSRLRKYVSPLRAMLGGRFVVIEASEEGRLEILIALEDQGWIEDELEANGAVRTGPLLDGGSSFRLADGSTLDVIAGEELWLAQALECPQTAPNGLPVIGLPYLVLFRLGTGRGDLESLIALGRLARSDAPKDFKP